MKNVINVFYLLNGTLQLFPAISTNSPLASFIPVGFVILVGMILEIVADFRRYLSDQEVNTYKVARVTKEGTEETTAAELQVGDVVELTNDCAIQADCIVLSTNDPNGQCYISTSQLDGERNLKPKLAPTLTMAGY